jgi:DNA-binding transcriptional LysR family regulator
MLPSVIGISGAADPQRTMHAALVSNGPYLTTLPGSLVHFGVNHLAVKVLPIKVPVPPSPVGIVTLKRRTINPVARLFIDHAREVAKPLAG